MASADDGRPRYVMLRKGRWFWEPPARLRASRGLKVAALGADTAAAWALGHRLNRDLAGLDPDAPAPGTVAWVFAQFEVGEKFSKLAASTQGDYRWLGKRLGRLRLGQQDFGRYPARSVKARHADRIYELIAEESGRATAHYACRYARRVWKWAGRKEFVDPHPNPWSGMELPTLPQRTQRWTPAQVRAFIAAAREADRFSLALAARLAYDLTHRGNDLLALTWTDLDKGERKTSKTGIVLPLVPAEYPELAAMLAEARAARDAAETPNLTVLICEMTGRPWQEDTFRHEVRRIARIAGVPDEIQFRDLRATGLTELGDGQVTEAEHRTHGGHLTPSMRLRYQRPTRVQFANAAAKRRKVREQAEDE